MRNGEIGLTMRLLVAVMFLGGLDGTSQAGLFGTAETPGEPASHLCSLMRLLADLDFAPSYR